MYAYMYMEAAPKNPTPDGTAAATREASHDIGPETKAYLLTKKNYVNTHTVVLVWGRCLSGGY